MHELKTQFKIQEEGAPSHTSDLLWLLSAQGKLVEEVQQQRQTMSRIEDSIEQLKLDETYLSHNKHVLIQSMDMLFNMLTANKIIAKDLLNRVPETEGWIRVRKPAWRTHLENALQAQIDGFETVRKKLIGFLADLGVGLIAPQTGEPFDPYQHRALEHVPIGKSGCIYALIRYGYTEKGDLLRYADVSVSKSLFSKE